MTNKTLSIVSYVTLIGWLIAWYSGKDHADTLLKYHLRQSLGMAVISMAVSILFYLIASLVPILAPLQLAGLILPVFWVLGMINAANGAYRPVPLFGKPFEKSFSFIG
ncbi:DUF4870 domain-containing protein [Chitinophaga solisilvae]|uniref:DUF4870 domain-containing protein n=1 Tax=Chitinophaga solisilvae TaxID=1233460 RepID=A0A3S1DN32_9BACT|nr:DUF4870 domain-containing protein [Chitinophaga solisilvae]NSL86298.1 DUF4870 domain-containing protein [Chitinophaga solisilvae]